MKLSVLMITYNHEKYIAQALDSVLMQDVNFDYEIVIGEDCSTDNTRNIVIEYQKKNPDKIRLLMPEKNLGMIRNFVATYNACQGQYVAMLEGDDYWTSPDKLQTQVDFLDSHPECAISFHNVAVVYENNPEKNHSFHSNKLKQLHNLEDIVSSHFIPTCSTVFRNKLFKSFPEWYYTMPMGDWPLHILNAQHGNACYIDKIMASYRVHEEGVWSKQSRVGILRKSIEAAKVIDHYTKYEFNRNINRNIAAWHYEVAQILSENDLTGTGYHAFKGLVISPFYDVKMKKSLTRVLISAVLNKLLGTSRKKQ